MTIPTCSAHPTTPCPVGCFDDVHVREVAEELAKYLRKFLKAGERWHGLLEPLTRTAYDYRDAIQDPRSEREWPLLSFDGKSPCDPSGWCVNASNDEMADLYYALRGPIIARTKHLPDGRVCVEEVATHRLPRPKARSAA